MISVYSAAVLATTVITGLAVLHQSQSEQPQEYEVDGKAMHFAHSYAIGTSKNVMIDFDASVMESAEAEIPLGPFYGDGRAESHRILKSVPPGTIPSWTYDEYVITWISADSLSDARRVSANFHPDPASQKQGKTVVGVWGDDLYPISPDDIPISTLAIPEGSIVAITQLAKPGAA